MVVQRREHYRVNYPDSLRPTILTETKIHEVIDISLNSIRFKIDDSETFSIGDSFSGQLKFYDDLDTVKFEGQILRILDKEIIISLERPLSIQRIKQENLFIAYKLQLLLLSNLPLYNQSV